MLGSPVADIADALDARHIPHVFTGGLAYSAWVAPKGTKDLDVVVHAKSRIELARFLNYLEGLGVALRPKVALAELDRQKLTVVPMPIAGGGAFPVELLLPKVPAVDGTILRRALTVPYPDRPQGIKVVTPEDLVLFKIVFFRNEDKRHIKDVLKACPGLDVGYVLSSLSLIYPEEDKRIRWFSTLARRYGHAHGQAEDRR